MSSSPYRDAVRYSPMHTLNHRKWFICTTAVSPVSCSGTVKASLSSTAMGSIGNGSVAGSFSATSQVSMPLAGLVPGPMTAHAANLVMVKICRRVETGCNVQNRYVWDGHTTGAPLSRKKTGRKRLSKERPSRLKNSVFVAGESCPGGPATCPCEHPLGKHEGCLGFRPSWNDTLYVLRPDS